MSEAFSYGTAHPQSPYTRTWWGARWQNIISVDTARYAKDVMQGEALFRRGGLSELTISAGVARAQVLDRNESHLVSLNLPVYGPDVWATVATVVAEQLRFTAALLRHQFPASLDERLTAANVSLFPSLDTMTLHSAGLGNGVNRHTVALHRAVGARIDRDPNVLFTLRGRDTEQLVRAVNTKRGETRDVVEDMPPSTPDEQIQALRQLVLHPRQVDDAAWLIGRLDEPPPLLAYDTLVDALHRAATVAFRIAAGDGAETADTELLLAELRARRIGTAAALAQAIGHDPEQIASQLDALYDAGVVLRTGTPPNVKYRVADR